MHGRRVRPEREPRLGLRAVERRGHGRHGEHAARQSEPTAIE